MIQKLNIHQGHSAESNTYKRIKPFQTLCYVWMKKNLYQGTTIIV
jgi:hypothetical protein